MRQRGPTAHALNRVSSVTWGQNDNRDTYLGYGFDLRRLLEDHGAPSVRLPRELIRHLGWNKRTLLWVTMIDDVILIGRLKYEDPTEVAHDKVDEVRRIYGPGGPSNNSESGERRNGD